MEDKRNSPQPLGERGYQGLRSDSLSGSAAGPPPFSVFLLPFIYLCVSFCPASLASPLTRPLAPSFLTLALRVWLGSPYTLASPGYSLLSPSSCTPEQDFPPGTGPRGCGQGVGAGEDPRGSSPHALNRPVLRRLRLAPRTRRDICRGLAAKNTSLGEN